MELKDLLMEMVVGKMNGLVEIVNAIPVISAYAAGRHANNAAQVAANNKAKAQKTATDMKRSAEDRAKYNNSGIGGQGLVGDAVTSIRKHVNTTLPDAAEKINKKGGAVLTKATDAINRSTQPIERGISNTANLIKGNRSTGV